MFSNIFHSLAFNKPVGRKIYNLLLPGYKASLENARESFGLPYYPIKDLASNFSPLSVARPAHQNMPTQEDKTSNYGLVSL